MFCILCGKEKQNHTLLIKHLRLEHSVCCGYSRVWFANDYQLSVHMKLHDSRAEDTIFNATKTMKPVSQHQRQLIEKKQFSEKRLSKSVFQCNICLSQFLRRFDLKKHKIKHHSVEHSNGKENSNIISESCEVILVSPPEMGENVNDVEEVRIKSDIHCDTVYSDDSVNSEDISRHLDVKLNDSMGLLNQNYSCSTCSLTFNTKQEISSHQLKEHAAEQKGNDKLKSDGKKECSKKQFSCSFCSNLYSRNYDLQKHICKKHGGDRVKVIRRCVDYVDDMEVEIINRAKQDIGGTTVYRCDVCDKKMRTRRGFVRHIRIHTGDRPFTCHICGKQYISNADLTRHLRCVHDGVKNYQCDICGRYFAGKGTRNDHRRTHTGEKPYVCHICGKSFPTPNSIYVHRRIHTEHFPHQCTTCDKKFRTKQQLSNHFRTHTGEKPHACEICCKSFCTKSEVSRHRLTHSNEKPHVCSSCGIRFGQKRYLSNHMKTNHFSQ